MPGVLALAWALAAHALWHSTVPGRLHLPHVDPRTLFSPSFLRRSASYERLLDVERAARASVTLLAVLVALRRRGIG